jgi:ornithine cyclodeaminase
MALIPVVILNHEEVTELLAMRDCIDLMAETLAAQARGEASQPVRTVMPVPGGSGLMALMPGFVRSRQAAGAKIISVYPGNWGTEYESHQGVILLFETEHGSLKAVVDAGSVTGIRTAAVSGAATRTLAREDAGDLAILGSGVQAEKHLEAMLIVRKIRRVRVWSRNPENRRRFAQQASRRYQIDVEPASEAKDAVTGADLICTTTAAREPIVEADWIAEGAHINAVGACTPQARELSTMVVVRSTLFADRLESLLKEAGDYLIPEREGALRSNHVRGEIGQALSGMIPGRTSQSEITLFKSLGLAIEDVACAHFLHGRATGRGDVSLVPMGQLKNT